MMLSNADWLLIRAWRQAGIPLRIVLRGIRDALDAHAHSWSRERKVGSLRYCAAEVDAARERWERALALGEEEGKDLPESLRSMAEALDAGGARFAAGQRSRVEDVTRRLRERAEVPGDPRETEAWLQQEEAGLLALCREDVGVTAAGRLEDEIERDLLPYRDRMPARVLKQIRGDSIARRLLALRGLPRLSLFEND